MKVGQPFTPYHIFIGAFIPNALLRYKGIGSTEKLCWARLAQYGGQRGICWPKQATLAEELGISKDRVHRIIKNLKDEGFIEIIPPSKKELAQNFPNKYRFLWHVIFEQEHHGIETEEAPHPPVENNGTPIVENNGTPIVENNGTPPLKTTGLYYEEDYRKDNNKNQVKSLSSKRRSPPPVKKPDIKYLENFPSEFQESPRFQLSWTEWLAHRKEKNSSLTPTTAKKQAKFLVSFGLRISVQIIERSITAGWLGLFEPDDVKTTPGNAVHSEPGSCSDFDDVPVHTLGGE